MMKSLKKRTEQEVDKIINDSINGLDIEELAELCKQVSEKHLDPDNELYKYYHELVEKLKQKHKT